MRRDEVKDDYPQSHTNKLFIYPPISLYTHVCLPFIICLFLVVYLNVAFFSCAISYHFTPMQYVGKVGGYVYNQWNSLNPATLSGAIDIIVVEHPDGSLHCSPWHVRFGKFQIIKPSQKKIDLYVNDIKTDLPMKLGDGGEACFVFETDGNHDQLSQSVLTSPVISPVSSPGASPGGSPLHSPKDSTFDLSTKEPELFDLNEDLENKIKLSESPPSKSTTPTSTQTLKIAFEKARKITQKLNIPSKIDINGDMVLDMDGYKPNSQKNIDNSDEFFKKIFYQEINDLNQKGHLENPQDNDEHEINLWDQIISRDADGNIRILNTTGAEVDANGELLPEADLLTTDGLGVTSDDDVTTATTPETLNANKKTYFKTLRLTAEQLLSMNLNYGENKLRFKLSEGNSQILSNLYLWKSHTPIVISDIDGTITKSDALGHVLNLFGRDWTHPGVANLFQDIKLNGYNIIYLTARSVGQAETTRQYLQGISQDGGIKLPKGPVILSPDRTMAALKREVILKKPEVFKMACLNDIKSLYFSKEESITEDEGDDRTPFYAGFGNRITDAISYRSVKIPSHRIFTINPNGEVHMELLELAGYKSLYLHIGELVDHFFPPIKEVSTLNLYWNSNQFNEYISYKESHPNEREATPGSPGSPRSLQEEMFGNYKTDERYNDVNYWREPLNMSDLSDLEDDETQATEESKSDDEDARGRRTGSSSGATQERPTSMSSFTSPLKNFMTFGNRHDDDDEYQDNYAGERAKPWGNPDDSIITNDSDYTEDEDEDEDDEDYEDEDYEDDYDEDTDEDAEDAEDEYDEEFENDINESAVVESGLADSPSPNDKKIPRGSKIEPKVISASEFAKQAKK